MTILKFSSTLILTTLFLMACSDGVWHYFTTAEIGSILSSLSAREATEFLIEKARSRGRGGGDNLSLVVVKFERS